MTTRIRPPGVPGLPESSLFETYRAWDAGARAYRKKYRGKVLYERAVVALCEHLWAIPDTHALVRSWHDPDKKWAARALGTANVRLSSDQLEPVIAEAYQRRLQDIQRQMAGVP